ncbi:MAG: glutamyl-tRNA reductase [Salinirussus sp.]
MTGNGGIVHGASLAHHHADIDQLANVSVTDHGAAAAALMERPDVSEAFVLGTCNRVEAYVVVPDAATGRAALEDHFAGADDDLVRWMDHAESLRHLMRVAAGLESQIIGEDEIIGQVRRALEDAREVGAIGPVLSDGIEKALHVGERARTETAINEGALSLASAAVTEAADVAPLDEATGVVVGAGDMGQQAATALGRHVDQLLIANRTLERAEAVAEAIDGPAEAVGIQELADAIADADVAVTATGSPEPIIEPATVAEPGETVFVDIAQPRDVAPAVNDMDGITLLTLDDIEARTDETRRRREAAAAGVEEMIETALQRLLAQYKRQRADQVISAMYAGAERIKAEEVETALGKLDLDDDEAAVVEAMADSIVGQLLAPPTDSLRDAAEEDDWSTIHTAIQLFDPSDIDAEMLPAPEPTTVPDEVRDQLPAAVRDQLEE